MFKVTGSGQVGFKPRSPSYQHHGSLHCTILMCGTGLSRRRTRRALGDWLIAPLVLLLFFPGTAICGEWLPSGVLNVTCPDKDENWQLACLRSGVGVSLELVLSEFGGSGKVSAHSVSLDVKLFH